MVPDVAKTGHSFRGAFAYYLHDKREAGETRRSTSERVAWTETRNLETDDPEEARHIMTATAQNADALKAAAGVKSTGRKSTAHVYAYALSWHPDEAAQLDRAEMVRAADASLAVLGADRHQAVIVCHADRDHPHVHVIINRVDPQNGKMLGTSNDYRKLSAWAHEYEKTRGPLLTPARADRAAQAAWGQENYPDAEARRAHVQHRRRRQKAARQTRQDAVQGKAKAGEAITQPADLRDLSQSQKARHAEEWRALRHKDSVGKSEIYADFAKRMQQASAQHREATKPIWAQHFKDERARARELDRLGRTWLGAVALSVAAAREDLASGQVQGRGFLSLTYAYLSSPTLRQASFDAASTRDRLALANILQGRLTRELAPIRSERAAVLAKHRGEIEKERAALSASQKKERSQMGDAWRRIYAMAGKDPKYLATGSSVAGRVRSSWDARTQDRQGEQSTAPQGHGFKDRARATLERAKTTRIITKDRGFERE